MERNRDEGTAATTASSPYGLPALSSLPEEVVVRVLQWVGCRDLCAIAACSHWGHRVANDDHLWKELFKRDRRRLPYLTDLCFAASPVVLQLSKKPAHKAWREYYKHRFITELERWESSSHQLQLWDGNYNPSSAATHARDVVAAPQLRLHRPAPPDAVVEPPTAACHHRHRDHQRASDPEASDLGSSDRDEPSSSEDDDDDNDGTEGEEEGEERGLAGRGRERADRGSRSESEAGGERERESESESEERDEERRRKVVKAQVMLARRKRRMISRSTPASTATSPRRRSEGTSRCLLHSCVQGPSAVLQPPSPFIPYYPPVFPQAKRKAVAFIGPRGSGKATLFYLLKFGRMFRGVRYLRKFGGIVSLDLSQLHCHLELEVWDITTEGNLDINEKIVPFYQLHGVIIIVDGNALCPDQCSVIRGILQRILNTPPACQNSMRRDSTAVVDYAWLFPPPVLVYNNKCDLQPPGSAFDVASMLDLDGVLGMREAGSPLLKKSGRWRVQSCSALDGRGVIPGMQWLHESMQANN